MSFLLAGIAIVISSIVCFYIWWWDFIEVFRGFIPLLLAIVGLLLIGLGIKSFSPAKDKKKTVLED